MFQLGLVRSLFCVFQLEDWSVARGEEQIMGGVPTMSDWRLTLA